MGTDDTFAEAIEGEVELIGGGGERRGGTVVAARDGGSPRENCEILFVCCVSYTWIHRAGHALRCPCCVPVTGVGSPPSGTDP
jgi:hypothetical protein